MGWLDSSYTNHILHCSFYTGALAFSLKAFKPTLCSSFFLALPLASSSTSSSTSSSSSSSFSTSFSSNNIISILIGSIAALNLYSEINYVIKRNNYLPPGNSGYPIIGHVLSWLTNRRTFLMGQMQKYGCPCTVNFLMKPSIVLVSDEDVNWVMTQERKGNLVRSYPFFVYKIFGNEAILFQSGASHRRLRRIFEPSFAPSATRQYCQLLDDIVKVELQKLCDSGDFSSSEEWALLAMRLFFACAFKNDCTDDDENENENNDDANLDHVRKELQRLFKIWLAGNTAIVPIPIPGNCLYKALVAKEEIGKLLQVVINDFKAKNPPGSPGAESTMLGRLCYSVDDEDGATLTDEQLLTNIRFVVFSGHDTTKGSFGSFAHFLVKHPEVREMLVKEARGFSEPLDFDELKNAPLLNAFLAETWRHVPPIDVLSAETAVDLEYKGYKLQKGVGVAADLACDAMMNEDRFPNPFEFRVERWLPKDHPLYDPKYGTKEGIDYNLNSPKYRSFGYGVHMCLGSHFAKLEARIVLTRLFQNYDIEIRNDELVTGPVFQYRNEFKLTKKS